MMTSVEHRKRDVVMETEVRNHFEVGDTVMLIGCRESGMVVESFDVAVYVDWPSCGVRREVATWLYKPRNVAVVAGLNLEGTPIGVAGSSR